MLPEGMSDEYLEHIRCSIEGGYVYSLDMAVEDATDLYAEVMRLRELLKKGEDGAPLP